MNTPSAGSSAPAPNFQERELSFSQVSLLPPLLSIGIDLLASSDSGISNSDNITNDNTPTFDVNFAGGLGGIAKVQVLSDGQVVGETTLSSPTRVTTSPLTDGSHTITARALNILGNSLAASAPLNANIDTQNPSLSITAPIANWSHSQTARLIGSASDGGAGISTTRYSLDGGTFSSLTANASGAFDALIAPGGIAIGNHNVAVSTSDIAGNQTSQTVNFQVTDNFLIKAAATQGWGAYTSDALRLEERNSWLTETAIPIELGFSEGTRTLQFQVQQKLDTADKTSAREDEFEVLLIDPNNTGRILLDGSEPSKAIFSLAGSEANYTPGLVRYDGNTVSIDLSSVKQENNALVVFRTINNDTDTGSAVEVKNITNTVDPEGVASPVFPVQENYAAIGAALDISQLAQSTQVKVKVTDACLNSATGQYTANLQVVNTGAALGRNVAVTFPNLPAGVQLQNPSGFDAAGSPYVNLRNAIAPGGLNAGETSDAVKLIFTNPNFSVLPLKTAVFVGGANTAPALPPIGALTVLPGGRLEVPLGGSDADGDRVTYSLKSSQTLPKGKITSDGTLIFTPTPDEVGTYTFTAAASDGALETQREITLTVAPDPATTTRISGVIQNTATQPLAGVVIELGSLTAVTDASGSFTIETPGALPSDTLKIRGEGISGSVVYPFIAEKLPLLLEHEPYQGANNVISRPIYLPPIDTANAQTIDPNADIAVTTAAIPGASVFVKARSLLNQQSSPYTGQLSITEVPTELTPAALPANLHPDLVVTIQPGEMVFTTPAPLSLPNRAGYDPGALMDLWSINPVTGFFDKVGIGKVSADGSVIETISGGIRNSSWHMFAPPPPQPEDPGKDPRNPDDGCEECKATCPFTSVAELHSGAVMETHELASYSSKGVSRTWKLTYDSLRADPRSILHFGYNGVPYNADDRLIADVKVSRGAFEYQVPGFAPGQYGLRGGEHFWSIPQNGGALDAALALDLRSLPSGQYDYALTSGIRRFNGEIFAGSSTTSNGKLLSVNSINSPWGSGWGLAGLQELVENPNGSVLLIDGDGSELLFEASPLANGTYVAPPGDFSTLERLSDGTFRRTMTDKTVYQFNGQNKLISVTDRNSNQTQHVYDSAGRLQKIVDPVGLETTFTYTGEKITAITDPANRVTRLEYDAAGNLKRIADPDTTARTWEYDGEHRIIAEVDKRNNREQASYDFAGRAETAIRKDGSKVLLAPVAVQGLYRPEQTIDPFNAPVANALGEVESFETDGNGNVKAKILDKTGQVVSALDGGGFLPSVKRDEQNLVTEQKNGRNNVTNYKYDLQTGKVLSISDELSGTGVPEGESENLFGSGGEYETGFNSSAVAVGDINSDLIPDLAVAGSFNKIALLLGNGDGSFSPKIDVTVGNFPRDVELNDINGDGKLDIVTSNLSSNSVSVLLGNGEGSFTALPEIPVGGGPVSVTVGDVNGDTWPDIITANNYDNSVSLLLASGNGGFTRSNTPVGFEPSSVASGYINSDNLIDVVVGYGAKSSPTEDRVSVLLGEANGFSAPPTDYDTAFQSEFVAVEDLDGDGAVDIVYSNKNVSEVAVLWSTAGGFTAGPRMIAGEATTGVAFDDVNGDGATDILAASYSDTVSVLLNNRNRTFTLKEDVPVGRGPNSAALADLDFDGDKDLITANKFSNDVSVRLKNTSGAGGGGRGDRSTYYDPIFNQVTSETDELGRQTLYEIDTLTGNTLSVRRVMGEVDNPNSPDNPLDPDDVVTRYTYTANDLVDTETDPNGRVTDYDYDPQGKGRLVKITFALGTPDEAVQQFEYDAAGNQTAMIDERGDRTEYKYDAMNRLERTTFAVGTSSEAVQRMEYDAVGNQTAMVDENGNRTEYQYDAMNRQTKTIEADPDGNGPLTSPVTTTEYDKSGNQVRMVDPLGRETQQRYDSRNRLVETINPDGSKERMRYDFDNNNTASFDANGNRTNMVYDARGRLTRRIEPLNEQTTRMEYDAANQLTARVDANNHRTEFQYDDLGRQTTVIDAPNTAITSTSTTEYDAVGNVIAEIDGNGHKTRYVYDKRDRQTQVIDALDQPGTTVTRYDKAGNIEAVTDPVQNTTTFVYDARNRLKSETNQLGKTRSFAYDGVGNRTAMTDRNNRRRTFIYDRLNRQTKENWLDAAGNIIRTTAFTYDAADQMSAVSDPNSTYKFTYDAKGRRTAVDNAGTPFVPNVLLNYAYDNQDNLLSVSDTINGQAKGITAYTYDELNRVKQITQSGSGVASKRVDFGFDSIGQYKSINRYADFNGTQLVLGSNYTYDAKNRLDVLTHGNATSPVAFYNFDYDPADQITQIIDVDGTTDYTHDKKNQLTVANHTDLDNPDESYSYDLNGNRITSHKHGSGYVRGVNNRLQSDGTYNYLYDDEGNLTRRTEIATNKVTEYTWDYRNRLVAVTDKNAAGTAVQKVGFTYDAMDRRLSKMVDANPSDTVDGAVTHFVYDRDNVLLDFVDADGAGANAPVFDKRYLHGTGVDQVLAQENAAGNVVWHLADHLGTVRDLVDNSGAVVNHLTYDSFGNVISQTNPTFNTRYQFTGREFDKETGLHYYRARYYDGQRGRFISEDPIGHESGDTNLYSYVANNPLNTVDPLGLYGLVLDQSRLIWYQDNGTTNFTTGIQEVIDARNSNPNVSIDFDLTLANISYFLYETGTDTVSGIEPPDRGFFDDRGHIVGKQLGGDGRDINNLFAQFYLFNQLPWRLYETAVRNYLDATNTDPACPPVNLAYSVNLRYPSTGTTRLRPNLVIGLGVFTDGHVIFGFVPN